MANDRWRPLRGVEPARLSQARLLAHYGVQWLARAARAYVRPQADDAHTNLGWDEDLGGFVTHAFADGCRVGLRFGDLTLVATGGAAAGATLGLIGLADADARRWLREQVHKRGLDPAALDGRSPYEMPAHEVASGGVYAGADLGDALGELAAWFANANVSLARLQNAFAAHGLAAPAARCWPHHFDLATLASFASAAGATAYVGAGLSPGDGYYDEPYFYVSLYPWVDAATLPALPKPGHWRTADFMAAVATAQRLAACAQPEQSADALLFAAVDHAMRLLR